MNWDDLRIALAVFQAGSYSAASHQLTIDETTVARRISRLERDLGVRLFEAVDGGRRPTEEGREILASAKIIEDQTTRISQIGEGEAGHIGTYRIAATDSVAVHVLGPRTVDLLTAHPGLSVSFMASTENVDFSRWQADFAVRFKRPDKGDFVISKLGELTLHLIIPANAAPERLLCAYPEDLDMTPESQFLASHGLRPSARCLTKNLLVARTLIESGRCGGILPSFMCQDLLTDDRFSAEQLPEGRGVWLLIQPHLKEDETARMLVEWLKDCFREANS